MIDFDRTIKKKGSAVSIRVSISDGWVNVYIIESEEKKNSFSANNCRHLFILSSRAIMGIALYNTQRF